MFKFKLPADDIAELSLIVGHIASTPCSDWFTAWCHTWL